MDIKHIENDSRGAFIIRGDDGKRLAEMTYSKAGETGIIIDHTEVDESLQGRGVGEKLVEVAVKYARNNNLLIKPTCPFVKNILESSEDYEDVLTR